MTTEPQTQQEDPPTNALERVLERLEAIEAKVDRWSTLQRLDAATAQIQQAPHLAAMTADIFDAWMSKRVEEGIDPQAAAQGLGELARVVADPKVLGALTQLSARLPDLARVAEDGPKMVAFAVDAFDALAARAAREGLEPDAVLKSLLTLGVRVTEVLDSPQFKALLDSDVLAPETLEIVGRAGRALTEQSSEACRRTGLIGTLRAAGDPDVQRTLDFALGFARKFGSQMDCAQPERQLPTPTP